jgi:hypothetical protein
MSNPWPNLNRFLNEDNSKVYTEFKILLEFHVGKFEFTLAKRVKEGVRL